MESEFFTLQDFLTHTKIFSYLMAVAFLFCFIAIWNFLSAEPEEDKEDSGAP